MKILVHIGTNTFFESLFKLSIGLRERGCEILFYFDNLYPTLDQDLKKLNLTHLKYIVDDEKYFKGFSNPVNRIQIYYNYMLTLIKKNYFLLIFAILIECIRLLLKERRLKRVIKKNNISKLIMSSDLVQYDTGLLIKVINRLNGQSYIFPNFFANHQEPATHLYSIQSHNLKYKTYQKYNKISFLKKWTIKYKKRYLIRIPMWMILPKELLKIAPEDPWIINTGGADYIAVEGEAVKYLFETIKYFKKVNIEVTGSVNNDRIHQIQKSTNKLRKEMIEGFSMDNDKPVAISAIPPDLLSIRYEFCDYDSYNKVLESWMNGLNKMNKYNILISLHPSVTNKEYARFSEYGFKLIDKPLIECLPLADLFIASISATIQWAIASGLPVINYDIYRYDYIDYNKEPYVFYTDSDEGYLKLIDFFNNTNNLKTIKNKQDSRAEKWAMLDGQSVDRIYSLLEKT